MIRTVCLFLVFLSAPALGQIDLQATQVASVLSVVDIKHAGDGSGRLFLVTLSGQVRILRNGQVLDSPFIDVSSQISVGGEQGLLSIAFPPDFASDGEFYLFFTDTFERSNVSRYTVTADPDIADPDSAEQVIAVNQPFENHNGGRIEFGPDGFLYVSIGDGGGAGDPVQAGQDLTTLLGKIIRIDPEADTATYEIPVDNPFQNQGGGARREIWAYGLRNPWRIAFDRQTGELYIGDVGQNAVEEIDLQAADSPGGENYGWSAFEGSNCFDADLGCDPSGKVFPVFEYQHESGRCSITGGQVYRGADYPGLAGVYFYADFCTGEVFGMTRSGNQFSSELLLPGIGAVTTFGEDEPGNVYMAVAAGPTSSGVYLLSDGPPVSGSGQAINQGMAGAWFEPATAGQGFLIDVDPVSGFIFIAWFTYDQASSKVGSPEQRWLTAQGSFTGSSADLPLLSTSGGAFDDPRDPGIDTVGSLQIEFEDCDSGTVTYDLPDDGLSGTIEIVRLLPEAAALCETLSTVR